VIEYVQAEIVIRQEAGRYFTIGHDGPRDRDVAHEILFGREYFVARAIADSETCSCPRCPLNRRQTKKGIGVQRRTAEELYATVIDTTPN